MSSDISDIDEETTSIGKKDLSEVIQRVSSKGWRSCSNGFDDNLEFIDNSPPLKKKRRTLSTSANTDKKHHLNRQHECSFKSSKTRQKRKIGSTLSSILAVDVKSLPQQLPNRQTELQSLSKVSYQGQSTSGDESDDIEIEVPSSPNVVQEKNSGSNMGFLKRTNVPFVGSLASSKQEPKILTRNKFFDIDDKLLSASNQELIDIEISDNKTHKVDIIDSSHSDYQTAVLNSAKSAKRLFGDLPLLQKKEIKSSHPVKPLNIDLAFHDYLTREKESSEEEDPPVLDDEDSIPIIWTSSLKSCNSDENISPFSSQALDCKSQHSEQDEVKIHISSSESESPASTASGMKGSNWLQNLTKHKQVKKKDADCYEDKTSKIPKFISGGLAEQVWKLENRERTSRVIWSHKKPGSIEKLTSKSMQVQLQTVRQTEGFIVANCIVLKKPLSSDIAATAHISDIDSKIVQHLTQNSETTGHSWNNCVIFLKKNSVFKTELIPGVILTVFPPWQTLSLPNAKCDVILCTYFVEVLSMPKTLEELKMANFRSEKVIYETSRSKGSCNSKYSASVTSCTLKQQEAVHRNPDLSLNKDCDVGASQVMLTQSKCLQNPYHRLSKCVTPSHHTLSGNSAKVSLSGRIQRIWQYETSSQGSSHNSETTNDDSVQNVGCTLLLQDESAMFSVIHVVNFKSLLKTDLWTDVLNRGEGKCYRLDNLDVTQVLHYSKHPHLFAFIKNILHNQEKNEKTPDFQLKCNKMKACCLQSAISTVSEIYPEFVQHQINSLKDLQENIKAISRFTGFVKVICELNSDYYVSDSSLKISGMPCIKLRFHSFSLKKLIATGSVVLLEEVAIKKGTLLIDKYSRISTFELPSNASFLCNYTNRIELCNSAKNLLSLREGELSWSNISLSSRVGDLVKIKGLIKDVNRETAVSWLQCKYCLKEDLYEDANSRIFCETCSKIVEQTILMMKMSVLLSINHIPSALTWVELTCRTTKDILRISDDQCQPKCTIPEVIGKEIGPIICYVRTKDDQKKVFQLMEVNMM